QRVYVLEAGEPADSAAVSRVFDLENPGAAVGACSQGQPPRFARDELIERVGCVVTLHAEGGVLRGTTTGRGCPTTQGGATYATRGMVVHAVSLRSGEHGSDATGAQRWGTNAGPYVFVRRSPPPQAVPGPREGSARGPVDQGQPALQSGPQVTDLR